jgi:hypothetical protein
MKLYVAVAVFVMVSLSFSSVKSELQTFSNGLGNQVKVVWVRQKTANADGYNYLYYKDEVMMKYDTKTDRIDTLVKTVTNYRKPLITKNGMGVVWSNMADTTVRMVNWDGSNAKILSRGLHGALWFDSLKQKEYVLYSKNCGGKGNYPVYLYDIVSGSDSLIFNGNSAKRLNPHWLCISKDGKKIGCTWPHGDNAIDYDIASGAKVVESNGGCWPMMQYNNTYTIGVFSEDHSQLLVYRPGQEGNRPLDIGPSNYPHLANYQPNVLCLTMGYSADETAGPGNATLLLLNDSLNRILDTVEITSLGMDGWVDSWIGDSTNTALEKMPNPIGEYLGNDYSNPYAIYSINGKVLRILAANESNVDLNSGVYLVAYKQKNGALIYRSVVSTSGTINLKIIVK